MGVGSTVGVGVGSGVGVGVATPTVTSDAPPIARSYRFSSLSVPANRYAPSVIGAVTVYVNPVVPGPMKVNLSVLPSTRTWSAGRLLDTNVNPSGSVSLTAPNEP